jgi:hypothetical protein
MTPMTNPSAFGARARLQPSIPKGDVVGSYETYPEAQQAVDKLAHAQVDVSLVSIVGSDLKTVERVTGRLTWGRVAGAGAASGAWFGLFFGLLITFFSITTNFIAITLAAIGIGAGFGIIFGLISYAITRRTRDFTSTHQVLASKYEVIVASTITLAAQEALARPDAAV